MQCLKKHGQRLDLEIAAEMRVPLATVRKLLAELAAAGEVVMSGRRVTKAASRCRSAPSALPIRDSADRGRCRALLEAFERNGDLRCGGTIANA